MKNKSLNKRRTKYLLYILLALFLFAGCNVPDEYDKKNENGIKYKVIVIDSCEYIYYQPEAYEGVLAHKGNCKFCAERKKDSSK